jgi:hypothetical protein
MELSAIALYLAMVLLVFGAIVAVRVFLERDE